jgi:inner membrane protein
MPDVIDSLTGTIRTSQMLRLILVGFLALLLQVPVFMIGQLISERRARRDSAAAEVASKWGGVQSVTGPALILPFTHRWTEPLEGGGQITRSEMRSAVILPRRLTVNGNIDADIRRRGIFTVPVYGASLTFAGEFGRLNLSELGVNPADVEWSRSYLAIGVTDARAIQAETALSWNGVSSAFLPGTRDFREGGGGIHAPVRISATDERVDFSFPLSLHGSASLNMVPFSQSTVVHLSGNSAHPSFQGSWLPSERTLQADSFSARWSIPFLGRGYPQAWISERVLEPGNAPVTSPSGRPAALSELQQAINSSRFGVELVNPVDHYRMADRSVKYAALFILLTFATVWLIEVLGGVRVHSIQYLLIGGALCLFFLLELSLAEHIGFPVAYLLACVAVVVMVGSYSIVVLRTLSRAVAVGTGVALLYGYLYMLLMNEDYALLAGSIGLFVILAAIMYTTRRGFGGFGDSVLNHQT